MPINPRPRTLTDVFTKIFDQGVSPPTPSPGQAVHAVLLTRAGVTTLGLAYGLPSIVRATKWIAVGNGSGTPGPGDLTLFNETARAPVSPYLTLTGQTIALALLPTIRGNGILTEMGLYGGDPRPGSIPPSISPNSGTLYVHTMFPTPFLKNCSKLVTVEWADN
jgi:hypothetical protein